MPSRSPHKSLAIARISLSASGYPARDGDFYRFYVDNSGTLEVNLGEVPEDMRARIDLYGKNFNWIARKDASNPGDALLFERDLDESGMYYMAVLDLNEGAHAENYSFDVTFEV